MRTASASPIALGGPLSFARCMRFPLQHALARREVLIGALWLVLVPGVGWLLNMGHRIMLVHNMMQGREAWPAWRDYRQLLRHGGVTFVAMGFYYTPSVLCAWAALHVPLGAAPLWSIAGLLALGATLAIPGFMSHYCRNFELRELFNPARALRRCLDAQPAYWRAWAIALSALMISVLGLLAFGVGFFVTSVWFWQVAGFGFATVMSRTYELTLPGIPVVPAAAE